MASDAAMTDDLRAAVLATIARAPEWIRRDLAANNEATRQQADEALAAMIVSALEDAGKR